MSYHQGSGRPSLYAKRPLPSTHPPAKTQDQPLHIADPSFLQDLLTVPLDQLIPISRIPSGITPSTTHANTVSAKVDTAQTQDHSINSTQSDVSSNTDRAKNDISCKPASISAKISDVSARSNHIYSTTPQAPNTSVSRPLPSSSLKAPDITISPSAYPAFPYASPYPAQLDLMRAAFAVCAQGKVGLLESPTGTGKTLSLLCATLEWLSRHTDAANRLEELGEEDPTHDNGIHFQVTQKETSECMKTGDADDAETERKGEVKGIVGLKEGVYQEDETINEENENVIELRKMAGGSLAKTIQELKDIKRNKEEIDNNQCTATNSSPSSSTSSSSSRSSSSTASSSTFEEPDWLFASVTETKKRQREERASLAKRIREYFTSLLEESSTYDPSERSYGSRHKTDKPTVKAMSNKSDSDKDGNGQDDDDDDDVLVETDELMELKKQWAKTQGITKDVIISDSLLDSLRSVVGSAALSLVLSPLVNNLSTVPTMGVSSNTITNSSGLEIGQACGRNTSILSTSTSSTMSSTLSEPGYFNVATRQLQRAAALEQLLRDCGSLVGSSSNSSSGVGEEGGQSSAMEMLVRALEKSEGVRKPQIIYCSRTHTQLEQFADEARKVFERVPGISPIHVVTLASRSRLCCHPTVSSLPSDRVNEACEDLRHSGITSTSSGNKGNNQATGIRGSKGNKMKKYGGQSWGGGGDGSVGMLTSIYTSGTDHDGNHDSEGKEEVDKGCIYSRPDKLLGLRGLLLEKPIDIEDAVSIGKRRKACAYYASLHASTSAHVVAVPYSAVFNESTRKGFGLSLDDAVIIVDEAHNVADAITDLNSATLTIRQASLSQRLITAYLDKFKDKLGVTTSTKMKLLRDIAQSFEMTWLRAYRDTINRDKPGGGRSGGGEEKATGNVDDGVDDDYSVFGKVSEDGVMRVNQFLLATGYDHVNMNELCTWAEDARVAQKLQGYAVRVAEKSMNGVYIGNTFVRRGEGQGDAHQQQHNKMTEGEVQLVSSWTGSRQSITTIHSSSTTEKKITRDESINLPLKRSVTSIDQVGDKLALGRGIGNTIYTDEDGPWVKRHHSDNPLSHVRGGINQGSQQTLLDQSKVKEMKSEAIRAIRALLSFARSLCNPDEDGRVLVCLPSKLPNIEHPGERKAIGATSTQDVDDSSISKQERDDSSETDTLSLMKEELAREGGLRFILLSASGPFNNVAKQARAILLVGGTMQPFPLLTQQLFPTLPKSLVRVVTCDHVVPQSRVLVCAVRYGACGGELLFTHTRRQDVNQRRNTAMTLLRLCQIVPAGLVVFFPSYDAEQTMYEYISKMCITSDDRHSNTSNSATMTSTPSSNTLNNIHGNVYSNQAGRRTFLDEMSLYKQIFREPRLPGQADQVWSEYTTAAKQANHPHNTTSSSSTSSSTSASAFPSPSSSPPLTPRPKAKGAMLSSVIGGRFSEGMNFTDDLARCVVLVGMPYPPLNDPVLREKRKRLDALTTTSSSSTSSTTAANTSTIASNPSVSADRVTPDEYYSALCMRAVNQAIGRVIRHANDYGAVVLMDTRYGTNNVSKRLSGWARRSMIKSDTWMDIQPQLEAFYQRLEHE